MLAVSEWAAYKLNDAAREISLALAVVLDEQALVLLSMGPMHPRTVAGPFSSTARLDRDATLTDGRTYDRRCV